MAKLEFESGRLTDESLRLLQQHTDMIDCQCPSRMLDILTQVRSFRDYTLDCIDRFPADVNTHRWLHDSALNLDKLLCSTLVQLARLEGYVSGEDELVRPG